jgi:hypothetical protein
MTTGQQYSSDAARAAAARDELGDWVARFLCSPGSDNALLAELLSDPPRWWLGPVRLRLDELHRLAGPPGAPVLRTIEDDDWWRDDVDVLAQRIEQGHEPPPVIVTYQDDQLVLEDGNHRVEALRRAGEDETWAIVGFAEPEARDRFVERVAD